MSQVEDPFSFARFTDLCRQSDRRLVRSLASSEYFSLMCFLTVALDLSCFKFAIVRREHLTQCFRCTRYDWDTYRGVFAPLL